MSVVDQTKPKAISQIEYQLNKLIYLDGEKIFYAVILLIAILSRFWDLGARVMSHDESLHTRYSWNLYRGDGFSHTPLMHGPLLFHMTALSYLLFGDNDFSARIYPAVIGVILVMMPMLMKKWLGKTGAMAASTMLLISPILLYYSRYIRHDLPAILAAVVMALATWNYIEKRKYQNLLWIAGGMAVVFASKEVSFIYIAIFGSFLTLYFFVRLLDSEWASQKLYFIFGVGLIVTLLSGVGIGAISLLPEEIAPVLDESGEVVPLAFQEPSDQIGRSSLDLPKKIAFGLLGVGLVAVVASVLIGQWKNLRRYPELDVMIVMGSLILPMLTPFVMVFFKFLALKLVAMTASPPEFLVGWMTLNPVDETPEGVLTSAIFTTPMLLISVLVGVIWGMKPPKKQTASIEDIHLDDEETEIKISETKPSFLDWFAALGSSRWWAIGGLFWLFTIFFFTTMLTNGGGLGTGIIGSLGYWLDQQEVQRGGQPWYYYILVMVPIYEFLPAILTMAAGAVGLGGLVKKVIYPRFAKEDDETPPISMAIDEDESLTEESIEDQNDDGVEMEETKPPRRPTLDLDAPIDFPVLLFIGWWMILNLIGYSMAGEKMPWLTTHLTTPMILIGGWMVGRTIDRIEWRKLWKDTTWLILPLIPLFALSLIRVVAPLCVNRPTNVLCNTIIPESYQGAIFGSQEITALSETYGWLAGVLIFLIVLGVLVNIARRIKLSTLLRLSGLTLTLWMALVTVRAAWGAAYINYDNATEYLVYAHSSGAVKNVMEQVEEISLKTTDGYGLQVAYDNRVSWPYTWYLRNYYNAVYYGETPSRGVIGDSPVILAGPDNWNKVESLLGDRYYQFEYIRMWWPMQDYFALKDKPAIDIAGEVLADPAMQRGLWDIFYRRDYTAYGEATGKTYELSEWQPGERMRLYIRKDVFAQVWDYGVAASEIAEAIDPYSENQREINPEFSFGSGVLSQPHGLSVDAEGNVYVADTQNHLIIVFDQNGNEIRRFGGYGLAPQPAVLNEPWDVSVAPDGTIYVADTWNHRIVQWSATGEYLTDWGVEGPNQTEPFTFWGPRGIAVGQDGRILLADTGNKRIQAFGANQFYDGTLGSGGGLDGQLDEPVGVAVDAAGNVYVADTWNQRVQVFRPDGSFLRGWHVEAWFAQTNERPFIAVDANGNVYITDAEAFRVIVFNNAGEYLYSFGDFGTITLVGGIAVDIQNGYLYVADVELGVIQRYDLSVLNTFIP